MQDTTHGYAQEQGKTEALSSPWLYSLYYYGSSETACHVQKPVKAGTGR